MSESLPDPNPPERSAPASPPFTAGDVAAILEAVASVLRRNRRRDRLARSTLHLIAKKIRAEVAA